MFISNVESALEAWLRAALPLGEEVGDVSFEAPNGAWSAQVSRITVNLFLYDVSRSGRPSTGVAVRPATDGSGATMRRRAQPMFALSYLLSVWAGSARDEHQLLGDVTSLLAGVDSIPPQFLPEAVTAAVQLSLGDERNRPRELFSAAGGQLRASLLLQATAAADTFDWELQAPPVERIAAMASRMPGRDGGGRAR